MINKDALKYLVDLGVEANPVVRIDEKPYSPIKLYPIQDEYPGALGFCFLDSLITYLKSNLDTTIIDNEKVIIEIGSPTSVSLYTQIKGQFNQRFTIANCEALVTGFPWGRYTDPNEFIVMTQSRFVETEDLAKIMAIVGNVKSEEVMTFSDDGISQQVTARSGIARVENVILPPKVILAPYRTFIEIEQPASNFIFRAMKAKDVPNFALFEADGGAWRIEAMKRIKAYLEEQLQGMENVIILG